MIAESFEQTRRGQRRCFEGEKADPVDPSRLLCLSGEWTDGERENDRESDQTTSLGNVSVDAAHRGTPDPPTLMVEAAVCNRGPPEALAPLLSKLGPSLLMSGVTMPAQDNIRIVNDALDAWNKHDAGRFVELLDEKHVIESDTIPAPMSGRRSPVHADLCQCLSRSRSRSR